MVIRKVETGISGLDKMLRGGFPEGRMILVMGGPGTGKTIFCSQFLYYGAKQEEKTVYISLDENRSHFLDEMLSFGWDFRSLEQDRKFTFIDAGGVRRIPEKAQVGDSQVRGKELASARLIDNIFTIFDGTRSTSIERFIGDLGAQRVVLDSISGLLFRFPEAWEKRKAVLDIMEALEGAGATCLITSTTGDRTVRILKMRGTEVDSVPRPYQIGEAGIQVHSDKSIY